MKVFTYNVTGTATELFPTETFFALLEAEGDIILEIQKEHPFRKGWGEPQSVHLYEREAYPMPNRLDMIYLSIVEEKFYSIVADLHIQRLESLWEKAIQISNVPTFSSIIVGMAPYGNIALWVHGQQKAILVGWMFGEEVNVKMSDFAPFQPKRTLHSYCSSYINADPRVRENLEKNGLPPRDLFDNYMKQFTYRYQVLFECWDERHGLWSAYEEEEKDKMPELGYIEEALYDGTHDKLHDGALMRYHEAGKPKKLAVQWHVGKSVWTAYFWFEDERIRAIYDRFYGTHRDTNTDFILRIDPYNDKYELSLYRYGLSVPQIISEKAYQLLVFKNKFECYRSTNYNQHSGAWIW